MSIWKRILNVFNWLKVNIFYIGKQAIYWTSSIIAISQIIGFLCDFNDIFPETMSFIDRLWISMLVVVAIWLILFIIKAILVYKKERVTVIDAENGNCVYVEYGDLLKESQEEKVVVVAVNRCFDTIVDDDLIAKGTIHGKFIKKICSNGYNEKKLNNEIQKDLREKRKILPEKTLSKTEKWKGNVERYPVRSIAELKKGKTTYFLVAMCIFNNELHSETTDMEYIMMLQTLIEYCNKRSQKRPVYMPILGTHGRSNKKTEQELLQYMVDTIRFHKHLVNTDIHIVVFQDRKCQVSIYDL